MGIDIAECLPADAKQEQLVGGRQSNFGNLHVHHHAALTQRTDDRVEPCGPTDLGYLDGVDAVQQRPKAADVWRVAIANPLRRSAIVGGASSAAADRLNVMPINSCTAPSCTSAAIRRRSRSLAVITRSSRCSRSVCRVFSRRFIVRANGTWAMTTRTSPPSNSGRKLRR